MVGCVAIVIFTISNVSHGQTAKYDRGGNLTFIGDLLPDTTGCEASKSLTGKITKVESFPGDGADGWEFVLAPIRGRPQKFQASLSHDEGAVLADLDELLQRGRRLRVKARQCGSGGFWTVEEIKRL
jgi:hypothetical protein